MPGLQAYFRAVQSSPGSVVTYLCYVPGMLLNALYVLAHHILIYHYPHFTDKKVKAHSSEVVDPGFEPEPPSS